MNKFITVVGVAAVATFAGCKDPNYKSMSVSGASQSEVKDIAVATTPPAAETEKAVDPVTQVEVTPAETQTETVVEPVETPVKPVEPEYTIYIVQRGDVLGTIARKYKLTVNSIKELNGLKSDRIRLGQKLKLPGKIDVGEQKMPVIPKAQTVKPAVKKTAKVYPPYTGETKEYVVKKGDSMSVVAHRHGLISRQLKELNGLKDDKLRIGQKLKVPATQVAAKTSAAPSVPSVEASAKTVEPAVSVTSDAATTEVAPAVVAEPSAETSAAVPAVTTGASTAVKMHTVQEGETLTKIAIAYGLDSPAAIREANNLPEDAVVAPGTELKIPVDAQD